MSCSLRGSRMLRSGLVACSLLFICLAPTQAQEAPPADRPLESATIERLAKQAESDLKGRPTHFRQYVDSFRHNSANDARLCVYDVTAEPAGDKGVALT